MKSILLTTTAIVAFAGAAAADGHAGTAFSGSASLGYNDDWEDGFYWDTDIDVTGTAALDNGVTASATFGVEFATDDIDNSSIDMEDLVISLKSESAGLSFGATEFAAVTRWKSAGDMEADSFSEEDGEAVLRGDVEIAGFGASVSARVANADEEMVNENIAEDVDQLSLGIAGDFGMFSMTAAYQEEAKDFDDWDGFGTSVDAINGDMNYAEIFALSGSVAVAGADITVGYAQQSEFTPGGLDAKSSIGVSVAYPFGPVTATAYYVAEDTDSVDPDDNFGLTVAYADGPIAVTGKVRSEQGRDEWNIDASYDTGLGLTVLAGALNEDEADDADYYVAGSYDLGGGAAVLVSYAEDKSGDQADEIGAPEYLPGTTVKLTFSF